MLLTKYFWQSKPIYNFKNNTQKTLDLRVNTELLTFSNDGKFLAMTYDKGKTQIINTRSMKTVKEIKTLIFNEKENILLFSPDSVFFVL
jgi:WD40 repeat protein